MFTIEEYIAKRKEEDNLNEFNKEKKIENIKSCIDYVFEYYIYYITQMWNLEKSLMIVILS